MSENQAESIMNGFWSVKEALTKAMGAIDEAHTEEQKEDMTDVLLDLVITECLSLYSRWDTLPEDGSLENRVKRLVTEFLESEGFDYE